MNCIKKLLLTTALLTTYGCKTTQGVEAGNQSSTKDVVEDINPTGIAYLYFVSAIPCRVDTNSNFI